MNDCYIVGAGDFAPRRFKPGEGDLVIAADAGCRHLAAIGVTAGLTIGDFDSLGYVPDVENLEVCPVEKDDTDTMIAARRALERGYGRVLIFGGTGGRLDHTLANIQTLVWLEDRGVHAYLIDGKYILTAVKNGALRFPAGQRGGLSVFCLGADADGVCESGVRYPLDGAVLTGGFPLGVSNEILSDGAAVSVENGTVVVYWAEDGVSPLPERPQTGRKGGRA